MTLTTFVTFLYVLEKPNSNPQEGGVTPFEVSEQDDSECVRAVDRVTVHLLHCLARLLRGLELHKQTAAHTTPINIYC